MERAKVYFTSFKATGHENLLQKLHRLMKTAGFENIEIQTKPVSKEYEERWGRGLSVGEYIMSSAITASKPCEG